MYVWGAPGSSEFSQATMTDRLTAGMVLRRLDAALRRTMELHQLRYFIRAAEMLHFYSSRESLYVSSPTLSSHIQQLEKELGCPLFDRVGRRVRLTEAGQLLLDHARRAIREVDVSKEAVAELLGLRRGSLRLGTTQVFSQYLVPVSLAAFISTYPEIHIQVHWATSPEVERRVLSGDIDFGLCFLPPESADIQYETLLSDEVVLVVSKKHPLAAHKAVSITDLGQPLRWLSSVLDSVPAGCLTCSLPRAISRRRFFWR